MNGAAEHRLDVLAALIETVAARRGQPRDASYTAQLLDDGVARCAKKLGEEAVETALAAVSANAANTRLETADLIYHLIVLLEAADVPFSSVMEELESRIGIGGLEEKAGRQKI